MGKNVLIYNIRQLLTMCEDEYSNPIIIENAEILIKDGKIEWFGKKGEIKFNAHFDEKIDAMGGITTPGLIDCHTHLIFGGGRSDEYEMRCAGISYEEIGRRGGGILSTVKSTRKSTEDELIESALKRLKIFLSYGVTTIEAKSGYGLSLESELKILRVIKKLNEMQDIEIVPTFLPLHALPQEYKGKRDFFIDEVINEWLPEIKRQGLATFCDVFCEKIAFSKQECKKVLLKAKELGFGLKIHAEQLSNSGGAKLAAELGAVSADHLEYSTIDDIMEMKKNNVVAVLLPGCSLTLCRPLFINARVFVENGVKIAISTDMNPGSSATMNLPLMATIGGSFMGLTPYQALKTITYGGALAIDKNDRGKIEKGMEGDITIFNCRDWREILYYYGINHCSMVIKKGKIVVNKKLVI